MIHLISTNDNPQPFLTEAEWAQLEQSEANTIASLWFFTLLGFGCGSLTTAVIAFFIHTVL